VVVKITSKLTNKFPEKMYKIPNHAQKVIDIYENFEWQQVVQMQLEGVNLENNKVTLHNKEAVSFGNASYLGLHKDTRVIEAGVDMMRKYGVQYCSTRSYTYMKEHDEFEDLLSKIFNRPTIATVQTAMADFGAMSLLMHPSDVALVDTMAHATLQSMLMIPKAGGMPVERVNHNDLDHLESKIKMYQEKGVERIWYVCDTVYSMYGDVAPVKDLTYLLDKYENFFIYFDDAHGMSWAGPNGAGYAWKFLPLGHPKVVMATSLGKGFGIGGGALVCPNADVKTWMRRAGLNLVFCTQLTNQMLGSGIEVAKIHLTNEIYTLQDKLKENIDYFITLSQELNLPMYDYSETPLFYMVLGSHANGIKINQMVRERGFYANLGIYPAVPNKFTGLRISITSDHTKEEIKGLLTNVKTCLEDLLAETGLNIDSILETLPNRRNAKSEK
jgi:7-keto-8-aminopelargonate synthetase-like enzyme